MGKIIATYHVKVTVREDDHGDAELAKGVDHQPDEPPTIAAVEEAVALAVARLGGFITANASAERTDR